MSSNPKTEAVARLAHSLLRDPAPQVVQALARSVTDLNDKDIQAGTLQALGQLVDPAGIDAVCRVWAETRHVALARLVADQGWVAQSDLNLAVLSAIQSGRTDAVTGLGKEVVPALLQVAEDADPDLAQGAKAALQALRHPQAREEICRLVIEEDHPLAREAAVAAGYAPAASQERALFYLLTEQWAAYEALDFDASLLRTIYETGDAQIRYRIAAFARQTGRVEFVEVLAGGRHQRRLEAMTDNEWELIRTLLVRSEDWDKMWRLAQVAPAVWSVRLLRQLHAIDWHPAGAEIRQGFAELAGLAHACREPEPPLGGLMSLGATLAGHTGKVQSLAFSPDSSMLASGGRDGALRLWSVPDKRQPMAALKGASDSVEKIVFSQDGRLLACGNDSWTTSGAANGAQAIQIWRWPDSAAVRTLKNCGPALALLPLLGDDPAATQLLAAGGEDGLIRLWRLPGGRAPKRLSGHTAAVQQLLIVSDLLTPDGEQSVLVSAGEDESIRLWSLPAGKKLAAMSGHTGAIWSLAASPTSALGSGPPLLASGSHDHTICVWQLPDGGLLQRLKGHKHGIANLAISPLPLNGGDDGQLLISASTDNQLNLWRLPDGELLKTLDGRGPLAVSRDGRLLVSGGQEGSIWLWQLPQGTALKSLAVGENIIGSIYASAGLSCLAISPDGRLLAAGGGDGKIRLWRSDLVRISRTPVNQLSLPEMNWIQDALQSKGVTESESNWLAFQLAHLRWRRRFDIAVEEAPDRITVGEFDIEIEG